MIAMTTREIHDALEVGTVAGWTLDEPSGELVKEFHFATFLKSLEFVNKIGDISEEMSHHPDILIRYDKVRLNLMTHDAKGITMRDFALAARANELVGGQDTGWEPAPTVTDEVASPLIVMDDDSELVDPNFAADQLDQTIDSDADFNPVVTTAAVSNLIDNPPPVPTTPGMPGMPDAPQTPDAPPPSPDAPPPPMIPEPIPDAPPAYPNTPPFPDTVTLPSPSLEPTPYTTYDTSPGYSSSPATSYSSSSHDSSSYSSSSSDSNTSSSSSGGSSSDY